MNYLQDDWADWLPIAEFASNNHTLETMAVSLFFANLGYDPRRQFDLSAFLPNQAEDQQACSAVKELSEIHDQLRTEMHRAQLHYQETTDTHRLPTPDYQVGGSCMARHSKLEDSMTISKVGSSTARPLQHRMQDFLSCLLVGTSQLDACTSHFSCVLT